MGGEGQEQWREEKVATLRGEESSVKKKTPISQKRKEIMPIFSEKGSEVGAIGVD